MAKPKELNRNRSFQKISGSGKPVGVVYRQDGIPFDHRGLEIPYEEPEPLTEDDVSETAEGSDEALNKLKALAEAKDKTIAAQDTEIEKLKAQISSLEEDLKAAAADKEIDLNEIEEFDWNDDTPVEAVLEHISDLKKDELIAFDREHFEGTIPDNTLKPAFLEQLKARVEAYYTVLQEE